MRDAVTGYLDELGAALRVRAWRRGRIVAEVSDHLAELVADERARGVDPSAAPRRAVERFGAPAGLAAEFNADAARHGLDRASRALVACASVAVVAAGLPLQRQGLAQSWPSDPVFSLVMQLWLQVPAVCGAIALFLAVVAPWLRGSPLTGRPAVLAGRSLALASVFLLPVAAVAAGNLDTSWPLIDRLAMVTLAIATPVAAVWGLRAASRAPWLADRTDQEDVLDVLAEAGSALAGRSALTAGAYQSFGRAWRAARARAPRATRWLDLRHHPWRAAASTSVAAGLALTTPDLLVGDLDFLAAGIEAAAVYVCFAGLGGVLGLRGKRAYDVHNRGEIAATA